MLQYATIRYEYVYLKSYTPVCTKVEALNVIIGISAPQLKYGKYWVLGYSTLHFPNFTYFIQTESMDNEPTGGITSKYSRYSPDMRHIYDIDTFREGPTPANTGNGNNCRYFKLQYRLKVPNLKGRDLQETYQYISREIASYPEFTSMPRSNNQDIALKSKVTGETSAEGIRGWNMKGRTCARCLVTQHTL